MSQDDSVGKTTKKDRSVKDASKKEEDAPTKVKSLEELLARAKNHKTPTAKESGRESSMYVEMVVKLFESHAGEWFSAPQVYEYTGFETAKFWHDTLWRVAGAKGKREGIILKHPSKAGLYGSLKNREVAVEA